MPASEGESGFWLAAIVQPECLLVGSAPISANSSWYNLRVLGHRLDVSRKDSSVDFPVIGEGRKTACLKDFMFPAQTQVLHARPILLHETTGFSGL
jgi:hypothetical protein